MGRTVLFCAQALLASSTLTAQARLEALGALGVGHIAGAGPIGVWGWDAIARLHRIEMRLGTARSGVFTGCDGLGSPCDLRDVSHIDTGAGVRLGRATSARAWTTGMLVSRVRERRETPRAMASAYLRRPWPLIGRLEASTELRAHLVPIRGVGSGRGWSLRLALGFASGPTA